jgi:hypothetical protein
MGTRGIWGFHKDGKDKLTYNHYDSYPDGLGVVMITFAMAHPIEELNKICDRIKLVKEGSKPTVENIKHYMRVGAFNGSVSSGSQDDWYCLLRNAQFNPEAYASGDIIHMIDNHDFIKDSLFCEWGYIINLDTNKLEIYRGFQKNQVSEKNRYKLAKPDNGYYSCECIAHFDLADLHRIENVEEFCKGFAESVYAKEDTGDCWNGSLMPQLAGLVDNVVKANKKSK